jgi:hypothetical protein
MENCKTTCEISGQLSDIKNDLTDIKNVIYRFDGIIAKQDKNENECVNRNLKLETEMKSELEQVSNKINIEILDLKNKVNSLQNRFTYIWIGISFLAPLLWALINHYLAK